MARRREPTSDNDDVIGVPLKVAASVIGVPEERLRRWETSRLLVPRLMGEGSRRRYVSYSLDELVQGRVIRVLEERGNHIRHIRRVVELYRDRDTPRPLSQLQWATDRDGAHIYVSFSDGVWSDDVHPHQLVMKDVIDLDLIRSQARAKVRERAKADRGRIERRRGVHSSEPVFAGTRTPVAAVESYLRRGHSDQRILAAFPHLTRGDIAAARKQLETAS
jgi:uncharacterized protein (DUF433 family)